MKLIKHLIVSKIGNENKIIINALNGLSDRIDDSTHKTIMKWKELDVILPSNDDEKTLLSSLVKRGYVVQSSDEEHKKKELVLNALRKRHATEKNKFEYMTFIMTYNCNFRCSYCFENDAHLRKDVLTPELIDAALGLAGDNLKVINLFGGEPLLPETEESIKYLLSKAPDKAYEIITNGYHLEDFVSILSSVSVRFVSVTLDGSEEMHNSRRHLSEGEPTYHKIISGIERCLENKIPVRVRMNVDYVNFDDCVQLQRKLKEIYSNYGNLLSFELAPVMGLSTDDKNSILDKLYSEVSCFSSEEKIRNNHAVGQMSPIINSIMLGVPMKPLYSFCYAHENKLAIDPYGNIFTCLVTVGRDEMAAGSYYPEVTFKENSIYNRNIDTIPECRECIYSLLCGGGCAMKLSGYDNMFKPACSSIQNQIHCLLPNLYKLD